MRDTLVCLVPLALYLLSVAGIVSGHVTAFEAYFVAVTLGLIWLAVRMRSGRKHMEQILSVNHDIHETLIKIKALLENGRS
jgi:hypothetical protein